MENLKLKIKEFREWKRNYKFVHIVNLLETKYWIVILVGFTFGLFAPPIWEEHNAKYLKHFDFIYTGVLQAIRWIRNDKEDSV